MNDNHEPDDMPSSASMPAQPGAPVIDKAADAAHAAIDQARDKVASTTGQVRDQAQKATEYAVGYTREEPVKAMLVAAAAGAVLMGLVQLLAR